MNNDTEEAWIAFKNKGTSIAKASVAEKLDVIAAQLNEIQTDTKRTAEIVPKIMGDETAIDEANASADMGMPPMGGDMSGGAPPEDAMMGAEEGGEMPGEEMPPEEGAMPDMGAEEGMPPAEEPLPEEGVGEAPAGGEGDLIDVGEGDSDELIGEVDEDSEFDYDEEDDDSDVIESLKDALQEALDNDQMGLVSKIADAISKLQGSSEGTVDILSGEEESPAGGASGGDEFDIVDDTDESFTDDGEEEEYEEDTEEETEEVNKSASVGAGGASPDMDADPGQIAASPDGTTKKEASASNDVKVELMEGIAEVIDEALGMMGESEDDEEDEEEDDEDEEDDSEEEMSEDKNEAIADNPFEECGEGTMKAVLKSASETSFKDLLSLKKSWHFGVDGRFAKTGDATPSLLDDQMPDVAENAVEDEVVEDEVEEIPLEDVESAKDALNAPDALEPGVRTEVEETEVSENETMPTETDEVGEPLNVSNVDSGLDDENEVLEEVDKSAFEKTHYGTNTYREKDLVPIEENHPEDPEFEAGWRARNNDVIKEHDNSLTEFTGKLAATQDGRPVGASADMRKLSGPSDKHLEKSATLDEISKPCQNLKSGKSTDRGDLLDDVDEKKDASGSAEPKPTVADEVGDADKSTNKGTKAKSMLDDLDAKKGTGSAKDPDDLLDQVGHEKRATEHTVKPGTGLLDDVKVAKSAQDNGKHIMSFKEMMSVKKSSQRPDAITTTSGDITRPELGAPIRKSANAPSPRMGRGVDPKKVVENDWAEYNLYMAQKKL